MSLPLNIDLQQILLHLFNFVLLSGGLYLLLYRPVKDFMTKREAHYQELARQADEALQSAEALRAERQQRLDAVDEELRDRRAIAVQELSRAADARLAEAQSQADKIVAEARQTARREHDKILDQAQKELVDLAVAAAEKVARGSADYDRFLDLAERGESHGEP